MSTMKKFLALLLSLVLVVSCVPVTALTVFAEEESTVKQISLQNFNGLTAGTEFGTISGTNAPATSTVKAEVGIAGSKGIEYSLSFTKTNSKNVAFSVFAAHEAAAATDIVWFWVDSDLTEDRLLHVQLNGSHLGLGSIYTIANVSGVPTIQQVDYTDATREGDGLALVNSSGTGGVGTYARIRLDTGWFGWIGIPVENFNGSTNTTPGTAPIGQTITSLTFRTFGTQDSGDITRANESVYFDEIWLTSANTMPNLTAEELFHDGDYEAPVIVTSAPLVSFADGATVEDLSKTTYAVPDSTANSTLSVTDGKGVNGKSAITVKINDNAADNVVGDWWFVSLKNMPADVATVNTDAFTSILAGTVAEELMLWFYIDGTDLTEDARLNFGLSTNDGDTLSGAAYRYTQEKQCYIDAFGNVQSIYLGANSTGNSKISSNTRGRVTIEAGVGNWIGIPVNRFGSGDVTSLHNIRFSLHRGIDRDGTGTQPALHGGDAVSIGDIWLTTKDEDGNWIIPDPAKEGLLDSNYYTADDYLADSTLFTPVWGSIYSVPAEMLDWNEKFNSFYDPDGRLMSVAHRGDRNVYYPENSLEGFMSVIAAGVDIIEVDVIKTKDGIPVVIHGGGTDGNDLTASTNINALRAAGKAYHLPSSDVVTDWTLAQLRQLRLKKGSTVTGYVIPTLEDVIKIAKNRVFINLDKWTRYDWDADILPLIKKTGAYETVLLSQSYSENKGYQYTKDRINQLVSLGARKAGVMSEPWATSVDTVVSNINKYGLPKVLRLHEFKNYTTHYGGNEYELAKAYVGDYRIYLETLNSSQDNKTTWAEIVEYGGNIIMSNKYPYELAQYVKELHFTTETEEPDESGQAQLWTVDEVSPVVINANNASSDRNTSKISIAAGVGLDGTQALKYELVTAGNGRTHTWTCTTPAIYGLRTGVQATTDSDVIWYWAHADCSTKQRLQLAISGETLAPVSGNYIYTIVENAEGKPELSKIFYAASDNADAPVDYVKHSDTQSQVLFDPGWSGWIGVPINMLTNGTVKTGSNITKIAVLLLQKTADGDAYADQKVGDAIILDEFWMTTEGLMPNLSDELLLYTAEDASQTPDPEPEPEPHQTPVWNQENNGVELNLIGTKDKRNSSSMSVAAGRGIAGSKALKYEATSAGAVTTAATESAPYARSITQTISNLTWNTYGGTDAKVSATDDIFWLWIDADLSTKQRFTFQLMGADIKIQDAGETYIYTIVDQNGTAAIQKILYSTDAAFPSDPVEGIDLINSNPSSNSSATAQIRIDPNYSGWIGIPLNMLNTVPAAGSDLTKFTLLLNQYTYDDPIEAQQVGDAVYMDEFWLTSAGLMPNLPDDQLLYQGQRELAFKSASLVIENGISVNFKADATLFAAAGYTQPYAMFTLGGITTKVTDYTVEKGNYVFRLKNIRPDWMGDTITATLHASYNGTDFTSEAVSYSVAQYCYNKLTKSYPQGTAQDKLATLLVDILQYGAAAQVYADHKTDELVTNALSGTSWQDWGTKEDRQLQDILTLAQDVETPAVQWSGVALFLREQVRIRFRISTALTEGLTLKGFADGKQILSVGFEDFVATSGGYYIFVDTLTALQMSQAVEYAVFAEDTQVSQTLTYSAETYAAKAVAANSNEKLADMMKAMIRYGDAARAYVGSDPVLKDDDTYNLLFIGNSATYYNQMPESIFAQIAESAGYHVDVTRITKGGEILTNHANPTTETGAKIEAALTGSKKYDYVILQELGRSCAKDDGRAPFYDAVRDLSQRIRAAGAEPILYDTGSPKEGHSTLTSNGWTNEIMTWRVAAAHAAIANELDIDVAYVGYAKRDVYTQGGIEIYHSDMGHPSYAGSYLAAMTIFAQIFRVDPTTVAYNGALDAAVAQVLKQAAKDAVFNTPQLPAEYVITSEGITAK